MLGHGSLGQGSAGAQRPREARLKPSDNHSYFDAVARHGSIRKAADALHMASSALNRRILDLEQEVGMPLFERLPRGVALGVVRDPGLVVGNVRVAEHRLRH